MVDNGSNVNQALLNGIKTMISQGYTYEQIKSYLLQKGYRENTILSLYNKIKQPQAVQPQQNNNQIIQIVDYIRNMETKGYTFQQIRAFLIQQGYSATLIDQAAANLPQQPQLQQTQTNNITTHKHEFHLPPKTTIHIIAIFLSVIIVISGAFYFIDFNKNNGSATLLDLTIQAQNTKLYAGDILYFDISVLSMGGERQTFDMILTYSILDRNEMVILREEETIAISTSTKLTKKITTPSDLEPGRYLMKVYSNYNGRNAISSFEFGVLAKEQPIEDPISGEPLVQEEEIPTNLPPIINGGEENVEVVSFSDFLDNIIRTSRNNPDVAVRKCQNIREQENIDRCIENVAIEFGKAEICEQIGDTTIRDDCYIAQLINGDLEVCENIINQDVKSNCELIRDLYLIQQYENGDTTLDELAIELGINYEVVETVEDDYIEIINLGE